MIQPSWSDNAELYKHYKGGVYELLYDDVIHTENNAKTVVYRDIFYKVYARPQDMFYGSVVIDGKRVERFTRI